MKNVCFRNIRVIQINIEFHFVNIFDFTANLLIYIYTLERFDQLADDSTNTKPIIIIFFLIVLK